MGQGGVLFRGISFWESLILGGLRVLKYPGNHATNHATMQTADNIRPQTPMKQNTSLIPLGPGTIPSPCSTKILKLYKCAAQIDKIC